MKQLFSFKKMVSYFETDAMKVMHHANYLRYFEDARVAWLVAKGLMEHHGPEGNTTLAVLETQCRHHKPAQFTDNIEVKLQVRQERLKIHFQYVMFSDRYKDKPIATGMSLHVPVDVKNKICRLPKVFSDAIERETWTETWP